MKTMISLWRHHYLRTVSVLLIAVVLIAGVVSCTPPVEYNLTMAVNPPGSGMATDETGTSPYAAGTVVDIKAVPPDPCYQFVDWTAPAGTFGDSNAATTTFTMPARDVTVTANFELVPADHFKFYDVDEETAPYVGKDVELVDQFGAVNATVGDAILFGNPVEKVHGDVTTPIADSNRHYTLYLLEYEEEPLLNSWKVMVNNQFQDDVELTVWGPIALAVPTEKVEADLGMPECLNHYLVYEVMYEDFPEVGVTLKDQFMPDGEDVVVWEPVLFANPVKKTVGSEVTDIEKEDEHLVFYRIELPPGNTSIDKNIQIDNQFGPQTLDLTLRNSLAVPSQKISWEQPLDHFNCYWVAGGLPPGGEVQLEDQFTAGWLGEPLIATVLEPYLFANPAYKWHGEVLTPISNWNNHLTLYSLGYDEGPMLWQVIVTNQVGISQELYVAGPSYLAVPTQKGDQPPPEGLDHFLVYDVVDVIGGTPDAYVTLGDQWIEQSGWVVAPSLFANPVKKTHGPDVTPIVNPDDHLTFYWIDGGDYVVLEQLILNQFGPQFLYVEQRLPYDMLGVPSEKIEWTLVGPWLP
jgi:hypothetical protein